MTASGLGVRDRLTSLADKADHDIDLAETACLLGLGGRPGSDLSAYLDQIDRLADDMEKAARNQPDVGAAIMARLLVRVLGTEHGFTADDAPDGDGGLVDLLDQRQGDYASLAILWLLVCRRLDWAADILSFPHHLLLRLDDGGGGRVIIDPAGQGQPLQAFELRALIKAEAGAAAELTPAMLVALDNRSLLVRMQNESKLQALRHGRIEAALQVIETTLLFAPDHTGLWREAGIMYMRMDNLPNAVAALEQFVARSGNSPVRQRTEQLLQEIRARMQ